MKTGEVVASMPVLDDLPDGYQVAVENSAIVYDDGEGTIVAEWILTVVYCIFKDIEVWFSFVEFLLQSWMDC